MSIKTRLDEEDDDEKPDEAERGKQDDPLFLGVAKSLYKSRTIPDLRRNRHQARRAHDGTHAGARLRGR